MADEYPNVLIVPEAPEKPEEIIEDYFEMFMQLKDSPENIVDLLYDFFDDVNYWSTKQMLIAQAQVALANLQDLEEAEHEFIEDEEDC